MSTTEGTRELARRVIELLNERNVDAVAALSTSDCKFYGFTAQPLDVAGYQEYISNFLNAFPDSSFSIDDVVSEGNTAAVRHTFRGTHRKPFAGIPATDKRVTVPGTAVFHTRGGKISECYVNADFLGMLQQLGAVSMPSVR